MEWAVLILFLKKPEKVSPRKHSFFSFIIYLQNFLTKFWCGGEVWLTPNQAYNTPKWQANMPNMEFLVNIEKVLRLKFANKRFHLNQGSKKSNRLFDLAGLLFTLNILSFSFKANEQFFFFFEKTKKIIICYSFAHFYSADW